MRGLLGGLVFMVCAVLAVACGPAAPAASPSASPAGQVVAASDGIATLTVPDGSLPSGTALSDIKIEPLTADADQTRAGVIGMYDLKPDGLTFSQPLILTLSLPWTELLPRVVLVSADKGELLDPTYTVTAEASQLSVTAPIAHFSTVVVEKGNIKATISNPGNHAVGAPFDSQVTVTRVTEARGAKLQENDIIDKVLNVMIYSETFGPITVRGEGTFQNSYLIDPPSVTAPGRNLTADAETLSFSERFKCRTAGSGAWLGYAGYVEQAATATTIFFLSSTDKAYLELRLETPRFVCLDASPSPVPPTITASPVPSVTATPKGPDVALIVEPLGGTVLVNGKVQLEAQAYMPDGTPFEFNPDSVAWTSSAPQFATVSPTGEVTGVAQGQVNISVSVDGSQPFFMLMNVLPEDVSCPPNSSGSLQGLILFSDPGEHADEFGIDPASAGWSFEAADGEISFSDGPGPLKEASGTFDGCNYKATGVLDYTGIFDGVPFTIEGSYDGSGGLRTELLVGLDGELGSPPTFYGN